MFHPTKDEATMEGKGQTKANRTVDGSPARRPTLLGNDCLKAIIYSAVVLHALKSAAKSWNDPPSDSESDDGDSYFRYSLPINLLVAAYGTYALVQELRFLLCVLPYLPPGSLGIPFLGNILELIFKHNGVIFLHLIEQGKTLRKSRSKSAADVFFTTVLNQRLVTLADSAGISWVWNQDRKSTTEVAWPPNISELLGPNSAANASGGHHRALRRLMEPFYAPLVVQNYASVITTTTDGELSRWHSMTSSDRNSFVSGEVFKLYALRLFLAASFGEVDEAVVKSLHDDTKIYIQGFVVVTGTLRIPGMAFDDAMKARERMQDTCRILLAKFIEEHPEGSHLAETTVMGKMVYSKTSDGVGLTTDEILDNLILLIFAGHDTTYASISTVLYYLTHDPFAMEALKEEVSAFAEPLEYDKLKNEAPILNAIMHEAWRMSPPISAGFRKFIANNRPGSKKPSTLEFCGYRFSSGTVFNYNINLATQDDNLYPSADSFRFQRFLPKGHPLYDPDWKSDVDPAQGRADYPIFGGGTHVCLGKNFAKMELRILLARIFMHYTIETRNPTKIHAPVNGWALEFRLERKERGRKS